MKYIRTKKDKIRTTANTAHHRDIAKASEVKSGGRYSKKAKKTYSKSYGFHVKPLKGDAKLIRETLSKRASKRAR